MTLDHTGVGVEPARHGEVPALRSMVVPELGGRMAQFERVLELASYPNLCLKWSHAPATLSAEPFPYRDVIHLLRRAIDAFGVERIMWASDYTQSRATFGATWTDLRPTSATRTSSRKSRRSGCSAAACDIACVRRSRESGAGERHHK